jgi:hypothetical protein
MKLIQESLSILFTAFANLLLVSLLLWMIGLVVLLFRELFVPGELSLRQYLYRVWKWFIYSFEVVAYGGMVIGLFMMLTKKPNEDSFVLTIAAILLSSFFLHIRKRKKKDQETST